MATRYFLKDTNAQTTCDASDNPLDLSQTQGTGATTVGSVNNTSFVEEFVWDIDVSGDSPVTGTFDVSVSVNAIDADTEGGFVFRLLMILVARLVKTRLIHRYSPLQELRLLPQPH